MNTDECSFVDTGILNITGYIFFVPSDFTSCAIMRRQAVEMGKKLHSFFRKRATETQRRRDLNYENHYLSR